MKHQRLGIEELYLYVKNPFKSKYQLLINRKRKAGIKKLKNSKEFIDDYSKTTLMFIKI